VQKKRSIKPKIRWKAKKSPDVWKGQYQALEVQQALIYLKLYFCSPALAGLFLFVALLRTKRTPPRLWAGGVLL